MKQKENKNQEKELQDQALRLNRLLDNIQGRELFKKSNDIAREMLKNMIIPEDLFEDKKDPR